jgi:hypothetical protein
MASKYLWTFGFKDAAKVLNDSEETPFVSVYAPTYEKAVRKIIKLKLPHVTGEEHLNFSACQEEFDIDEGEEIAAAN